jgi:outer membrane autotransporter protein
VFSFDGWSLGAYGGGIGMRYFVKDDIAIRPGLSLSLNHSDNDEDRDISSRGAEWTPDREYKSRTDETAVGLSVVGEKYLAGFHDIVPYLGLGVGYAYASDDYHYDYNYSNGNHDWNHNTSTDHSGLLIGLVGVQWRFRDNVSLGGEYEVKASLGRNEYTRSETELRGGSTVLHRSHEKTTSSSLDFESGRLLLAVRF